MNTDELNLQRFCDGGAITFSSTDGTEEEKFRCLPRISQTETKVGSEWELWLPVEHADSNEPHSGY